MFTGQRSIQEADRLIGERIRATRNQQGMTQDALACHLGVSFQQVQKYEKGSDGVSAGRLVQLCKVLGCGISDITDGLAGKPAKITRASTFAASREGVAVIHAMSKIEDGAIRRRIIHFVQTLTA